MPGKSNGSHRSYQPTTMREEEDSPGAQIGGEVQGPMRARPPVSTDDEMDFSHPRISAMDLPAILSGPPSLWISPHKSFSRRSARSDLRVIPSIFLYPLPTLSPSKGSLAKYNKLILKSCS